MVILQGEVRDGSQTVLLNSGFTRDAGIYNAELFQGSGWAPVYTTASGGFHTSANTTLNLVTVISSGYEIQSISIPVYATKYDPSGVVSGSLTVNPSNTGASGAYITTITDTSKIFVAGSLSGRVLTMQNGVADGQQGVILGNTVNTVQVGGQSGGSPVALTQTVIMSDTVFLATNMVSLSNSVYYSYSSTGSYSVLQVSTSGLVSGDITTTSAGSTGSAYPLGVGSYGGAGMVMFISRY